MVSSSFRADYPLRSAIIYEYYNLQFRRFVSKDDKFRGRPITALPTVTNRELCRIPVGELKLKTKNDLDHLRSIAEDRTQCRRQFANNQKAAEASESKL